MNGKTDTVGTVGSKLSGIDQSVTMNKAKMSQFSAEQKKWRWLLLPLNFINIVVWINQKVLQLKFLISKKSFINLKVLCNLRVYFTILTVRVVFHLSNLLHWFFVWTCHLFRRTPLLFSWLLYRWSLAISLSFITIKILLNSHCLLLFRSFFNNRAIL